MPTRKIPRFMISSRREACWACAEAATRKNAAARQVKNRIIGHSFAQYQTTADIEQRIVFAKEVFAIIRLTVFGYRACDAKRKRKRLHFAAVFPDQICSGASSDHFAFELLKSLPRLVLAIVHEPDGRIRRHGPADDRLGVFADRLIDVICAIVLAADGPFEADRRHRAGTDFLITVSLGPLGSDRLLLDCGFFRIAMGFRLIEDAGDGRQRMIGWVALTQNSTLRSTQPAGSEPRRQRRVPFLALEYGSVLSV